jgi:diadenosine tetraphosphate (Ap4A) HIT family hydrolase
MIVDKDVPAKIIEETQEALAVVEIKPVSKGHILVIPKKKVNSTIDPKVLSLARKIAKRAMLKLKPQGVEIQTETKFGEQVIDVIPYYAKPLSIVSPRYEAKEQELDEIYHLLKAKKRQKVLRQKPKKSQSYPTIKRRIP